MKGKNVLIVGGAGYIGGLTSDSFLEDGWNVTILDNLLYEDRFLKPISFINGDIRDTDKILKYSNDNDIIVLLAAIVGDPACNVNPKLTEEVNFLAIKNICERLPSNKHVIFASTCSVYGANEKIVNEQSKTNPLSCYASTKLKAEKFVQQRHGTIFRLGTVFGLGDKYSRIRTDLVVNTLTIKAFLENEITINGGEQWRPIISVRDITEYIKEASYKKQSGTFNLGYKNVRIKDLGDDIVSEFPEIKINRINQMYQDNRNYKVDTGLADSKFSYRPCITPREEIVKIKKILTEGRIKNPNSILYNNGLYVANRRL